MTQSAYDMLRNIAPTPETSSAITALPLSALHRDSTQPRQKFDEAALAELAASIKATGVIEPLVVTADPEHAGEWIILVGERRYRAAEKAGLASVPVVVRSEVSDSDRLILQLTENDQREDLTLREKAEGYMRLRRLLPNLPNKQLAQMLGRKPSTFTNTLLAAKVVEGPAFVALEADLIKDPEALRLFLNLTEEDQEKLLTRAKGAAVTLSRSMLERYKEGKDQKSTPAGAKTSPSPAGAAGEDSKPTGVTDGDNADDAEASSGAGTQATASPSRPSAPATSPKSANEYLAALTWRHWEILFKHLNLPLPGDPDDAGYTLLEFLEAQAD